MTQYIKPHPPGMTDNAAFGYAIGDEWLDVSVQPANLYVLVNISRVDAVWRKTAFSDGGAGVSSLNSLAGDLNLVAGTNITLTPSGTNITIDASGGGGGGVPSTLIAYGSSDGTTLISDTNITIDLGSGILLSGAYAYELSDGFGGKAGLGIDGSGNLFLFGTGSRSEITSALTLSLNTDSPVFTINNTPLVMVGAANALTFTDRSFSNHSWSFYAAAGVLNLFSVAAGLSPVTISQTGTILITDGGSVSSNGGLTFSTSTGIILTGGITIDAAIIGSGTITGLIEQIPGLIESPVAKIYPIIIYNTVSLVVNQITIQTVSGTCTASVQINGGSITGLDSIAVSDTPQTLSASALNGMGSGDVLTLVVTSPSSPEDMAFVIQTTRS